MAFVVTVEAQQARVETPISSGPGGFTLTVSTPAVDGPFDFAMNKGPKVKTVNGDTYGELMFIGMLENSQTAKMLYEVAIFRDDKANERKKPYTAEVIAKNIIEKKGYVGRAEKFNCPQIDFETSSIACYKMQGSPFYKELMTDYRTGVTVVAIALKNDTQGFAYIGYVQERDTKKFDSDSTYVTKAATGAAAGMFRNSKLKPN